MKPPFTRRVFAMYWSAWMRWTILRTFAVSVWRGFLDDLNLIWFTKGKP